MHGFSYLRLAAWLAGPIAAARWIIGAIGIYGYLLLVVAVTVGSVIIGYDAMFGDGKPRTGDEARILLLVLPVALLCVLLTALPFIDMYGRLEQQDRIAIRNGRTLAHWRFSREAWGRFQAADATAARREGGQMLLYGLGFAAVFGGIAAANGGWRAGLLVLAIVAAAAVLVGLRDALNRHRAARSPEVEVIFTAAGLLANGAYTRLNAVSPSGEGMFVSDAKVVPGPPALLELTVSALSHRPVAVFAGWTTLGNAAGPSITVRVPVPEGKTAEAEALGKKLIASR